MKNKEKAKENHIEEKDVVGVEGGHPHLESTLTTGQRNAATPLETRTQPQWI